MTNVSIKYRKGYKYQLANTYSIPTGITGYDIKTEFIDLDIFGMLTIQQGYAWDGPSGLTFDTKSSIRGSLVHDALYQLLRQQLLPQKYRINADILLRQICIKDYMIKIRAWIWFISVHYGAKFAADPSNKKKIFVVP
jgi:hypothetical protein